jgi:hypothetical protein
MATAGLSQSKILCSGTDVVVVVAVAVAKVDFFLLEQF